MTTMQDKMLDLVEHRAKRLDTKPTFTEDEELRYINGYSIVCEGKSVEYLVGAIEFIGHDYIGLKRELSYTMYGSHVLEYDGDYWYVEE